jgi:glucose-1-phosphate cytidylyltransferase
MIGNEANFCATYCDGLSDLDLTDLMRFHLAHGRLATLTAVNPLSNFGLLRLDGDGAVAEFVEKPKMKEWVNGGFFVFRREVFDYLSADSVLEREPLECLAREGQLMAYRHSGFWACLDTYKDHVELNRIWQSNEAKWKTW